jgi:hypothetical protein
MTVYLSEQLKEAGAIRIELLKTAVSGNKRFLLWVTEMDDHSMVHEFSSLLSIDIFCSDLSVTMQNESIDDQEKECSTILLTRLDEDESSTLESVSIGCFTKERALQLKEFIKSFVNANSSTSK